MSLVSHLCARCIGSAPAGADHDFGCPLRGHPHMIAVPALPRDPAPAVDPLHKSAADALVRWRRRWERSYASPPSEGMGQKDELEMWKVAGRIMRARGIKPRLKG